MKYFCALTLHVFLFISAFAQKKPVLSPVKFQEEISAAGIQVLDVRTMEEYTIGHIKNSLQADWLDSKQFHDRTQHLDKSRPLYVYCASGARSADAAKKLRKQGFEVYELQNGITGWNRNNLPLERDAVTEQMTMAQYMEMVKSSATVLIDFGAKWCPPCKKMEPILEQLQKEAGTKFSFVKIDAGVHTEIMKAMNVQTIPAFLIYKNGKETWRKEGLVTLDELKSNIQ